MLRGDDGESAARAGTRHSISSPTSSAARATTASTVEPRRSRASGRRTLSEASSVAAFRIVQESLTNARRHAAGAAVRVALAFEPDGSARWWRTARVRARPTTPRLGHGIMGMRERAAAVGGTFDAGPRGTRFRVERRAPVRPRAMIRVLVADDQAAVRGGFAALIDAQDDMEVVGEAANGREAVDLARRALPHVVLMDIRMPVLDGLEATR